MLDNTLEEITMLRKWVKKQDKEIRRLKEENEFLEEASAFCHRSLKVSKNHGMIFLALKTEDGRLTGKISFYCRMLGISRQGFYKIFRK